MAGKIFKLQCVKGRCGHVWVSRRPRGDLPPTCPKCFCKLAFNPPKVLKEFPL